MFFSLILFSRVSLSSHPGINCETTRFEENRSAPVQTSHRSYLLRSSIVLPSVFFGNVPRQATPRQVRYFATNLPPSPVAFRLAGCHGDRHRSLPWRNQVSARACEGVGPSVLARKQSMISSPRVASATSFVHTRHTQRVCP